MAFSPMSKPVPKKKLSQLLQDQQEPFKLEVYISERKYIKNSSSEYRNGSNLDDSSAKNLRSHSSNMKRRKLLHGSKVLRMVLDMLTSSRDSSKLPNRDHKCKKYKEKFSKTTIKHQHFVESSSSRTVFGSCSKGITEEFSLPKQNHFSPSQSSVRVLKLQKLRKLEAASHSKLQWGYMEESKQRSPVSVLEELPSEEDSPVDNNMRCYLKEKKEENPSASKFCLPRKATEDTIISASLCKLLVQLPTEKQNGVRTLMGTEPLVVDYVKEEVIDFHGRKGTRHKRIGEMLGPEELGKIVCDQIYSREKESDDGTRISRLMNSNFLNTVEEWKNFQQVTREIWIEIGDAIFDDIVTEMLNI